jgi:hypothetical protein
MVWNDSDRIILKYHFIEKIVYDDQNLVLRTCQLFMVEIRMLAVHRQAESFLEPKYLLEFVAMLF